jgi:hypothetical protein
MEYAEHYDFFALLVRFMHDDVRQTWHCPFIGAGHNADATKLGEFAEAIGFGKDATDDVSGGAWAAGFDIKLEAGDMGERFKREAHLHMIIDGIGS